MADNKISSAASAKPRIFYGYIVVAAALVITVVSFGMYTSFGVFFTPLLTEFGWTSAMTSGAFSLSMIVYGLMGIIMGMLNDRYGPRLVMTICGLLIGLGYLLMSRVSALWELYLFFGVIVGIGMSGVWVPQLSSIARWFYKRRSLMSGIVVAGAGIGQLIGPPAVTRLMGAYDWRLSYIILGVVVLAAVVIAAQFLRRDPAQMGQIPYGAGEVKQQEVKSQVTQASDLSLKEAVRTVQFWLVFAIFFCYGFGVFAVIVHLIPHALDLKISASSAAAILATMGGITILGNYVLGNVADRVGNARIYMICNIIMAVALFPMVIARTEWMLYLFAVVYGFASAGPGSVESPMVARLFGVKTHGLIYGMVHLGFTLGASAGPLLSGYIFDITRSYQMAFVLAGAFSVLGFILVAVLRPTKRLGGRI